MSTDPTPASAAVAELTRAAALLAGAALSDRVSPDVALLCQAATEQLHAAAALRTAASAPVKNAAIAIEEALQCLGALPPRVFAERAVLDAASYARRAHEVAF